MLLLLTMPRSSFLSKRTLYILGVGAPLETIQFVFKSNQVYRWVWSRFLHGFTHNETRCVGGCGLGFTWFHPQRTKTYKDPMLSQALQNKKAKTEQEEDDCISRLSHTHT